MALEFDNLDLGFLREEARPVFYSGVQIGTRRVDFLVEGCVSVEMKAVAELNDIHLAQAINYLEAFGLEIGLLINFGSRSLQFKRLIHTPKKSVQSYNQ